MESDDQENLFFSDEKRHATRRRVLLPAVIFTDALGPYHCVIRDLSTTGARLAVSRNARLASEMRIRVAGKRYRKVKCVWREADLVGLQFW